MKALLPIEVTKGKAHSLIIKRMPTQTGVAPTNKVVVADSPVDRLSQKRNALYWATCEEMTTIGVMTYHNVMFFTYPIPELANPSVNDSIFPEDGNEDAMYKTRPSGFRDVREYD